MTEDFAARVIGLFERIHPLDRVPRAGFLLRGVTSPESVAAHSHAVSLMVLCFLEAHPGRWDFRRAVGMALIHDLSEAVLMDIPMPAADAHFRREKQAAEQAILEGLFNGFSFTGDMAALHRELTEGETAEARLVRGLDKAQMMVKVLCYEAEHRGRLGEFWENPANFNDYGVPEVSRLFDAVCARAGRPRPR